MNMVTGLKGSILARVIVCAGAHKTASSLIQHHFKWRRDHYANNGLASLNRNEVQACVGKNGLVEDPKKLTKTINDRLEETGCDNLFYCFEDSFGKPFSQKSALYGNVTKGAPALGDALSGFDTRIVYMVRPQWEFLESFYLQKVHEGYFQTFNQFIEGIDLDNISWLPLIDKLRSEFGEKKVDIIDFRDIRKGQEKYIESLVHTSISNEIPLADVDPTIHNASISDRGLHIALRINPLLKPGWSEVGEVRKFLQKNFSNRDEPRPNLLSLDLKESLIDRYQEEYEGLV